MIIITHVHGKGPCDGLCGAVRQLEPAYNFRPLGNQTTTPKKARTCSRRTVASWNPWMMAGALHFLTLLEMPSCSVMGSSRSGAIQ